MYIYTHACDEYLYLKRLCVRLRSEHKGGLSVDSCGVSEALGIVTVVKNQGNHLVIASVCEFKYSAYMYIYACMHVKVN